VDARDGQLPGLRRAPSDDAPRVPELQSLLADIDTLRLTLQTDLTLAAAALEVGADELAAELVEGDLTCLQEFAGRADGHLDRLEIRQEAPDDRPVKLPVRRRRVLSAAPIMAAAAALIGFVAFAPTREAAAPESGMSSAALAGYELTRLASEGASEEQLRLAAEELHHELALLIAQADENPAAAQQALMLLEKTTEVLSRQQDSGTLRTVMAQTQALRDRLRAALPSAQGTARPVLGSVTPLPRIQAEPEKERSSTPTSGSSATPRPTPVPRSSSDARPPSPSPEPSPSPSEDTRRESERPDPSLPTTQPAADLPF
jgi:plasmid stabilization system protein ParE